MRIGYELDGVSVTDIQDINSSFAVGKLKVMYLGDNRNGTRFSKEAVEDAFNSLKNVPIVCHWDAEAGEIGGHDIELVKDDNGRYRIKNLTEPCGVVPESANSYFEISEDSAGNEHEYLVVDGVILWKRQDVYRHIVDELGGVIDHSMEIRVLDSEKSDDDFIDVKKFEFTALCLLEKYEPCFQGSELELYAATDFKQKMEQMMSELKETLNNANPFERVGGKQTQDYSMKGGSSALQNMEELIAKYGIDVDSLDFSVEDFTIEELEEKFKEMTKKDDTNKFALTKEFLDELRRKVKELGTYKDEYGEWPKYWYVDSDIERGEVYCMDEESWILYGFNFSVDGDAISIDIESKKRKKYAIIDFEDTNTPNDSIDYMINDLKDRTTEVRRVKTQYADLSKSMDEASVELEQLREFKADVEQKQAKEAMDALFAKFEDLSGVEAFEELMEKCQEFDLETLEEKCFAIRGRNGVQSTYTAKEKTPKLKVPEKTSDADEPYGGIMKKYSK